MPTSKPAAPRGTGKFLRAPANGTVLAEILEHDAGDAAAAVKAAKEVQPSWAALPYAERAACAKKAARWVYLNSDRLAKAISSCTGKTLVDALSTEVLPSAMAAGYYARKAGSFLKPKRIRGSSVLFFNKRSTLYRVPYGVVGIITPWNYPFSIPFHEVLTSLLAGNGVILKVATQVQPVGELLSEMVRDSGFPDGLFRLLHLPGSAAGRAFLDSGIGKLFFTGSGEVGRRLMEEAGKRLIPVNLELGGNDAMIVLAGANLRRAAAGAAWAGFANCGQSCGGVQRIFVERAVYGRFMDFLKAETAGLRLASDGAGEADIGSFISSEQRDSVLADVQEALAAGARVAAGSPNRNEEKSGAEAPTESGEDAEAGPLRFSPLVLEIDPENEDLARTRLLREETFGPVIAVRPVKDADEAIRLANESELGLTASVWTSGPASEAALRLEAGVVTVNDHLMTHGMAETPWGGFKRSGIGRSHGELGVEDMTQAKIVVRERLSSMTKNMWWYPHGEKTYAGLKGALDFLFAPFPLKRLVGAAKLAKLFAARFLGR